MSQMRLSLISWYEKLQQRIKITTVCVLHCFSFMSLLIGRLINVSQRLLEVELSPSLLCTIFLYKLTNSCFSLMQEVPLVLSRLCLHRGTLVGHVTCCWQEVAAFFLTPGTGACTLTFGDIITLPIRILLSFVRPDELVRVSTWDGEMGQTWPPHLGPRQTSITLCCSPAGFSCIICYQDPAWELCAPAENWALYPPSASILSALSFAVSCLVNCVAEAKKPQTSHPRKRQMLWSLVRAVQLPR